MDSQQLRNILESCLLVAGKPMSIAQLEVLFDEDIDRPARAEIKEALQLLQQSYEGRGIELVEIASGWRLQSASSMEHWVGRLFQEKQPRYSRALLETLVLIAYRQPITRGEIEEVRGVAVSSNIIRTLQEREWVKEMGYKDVPGKPALWGTTKEFLDYFNLKRLDELPTLAEARDLAEIDAALAAEVGLVDGVSDSVAANDSQGEGETNGSSSDPDLASWEEEETATETEAEAEAETDTTTLTEAGDVAETTDVVQTDKDLTAEAEGVIAEQINVDTDNLDREVGEDAHAGTADEGEPGSVAPTEAEAADFDGVSTEESKDANQPFLQLADVEIADTLENEDGADLISLAATLGNESSNTDQPDLGEVVEGFDGETNSVDANAVEATDMEPLAVDLSHSEQGDARQVESVEISAHDLDIGEWKAPEPPRQRPNEGDAEPLRAEAEAEADLRRVIDDFAEEHRQQLDADNQLKSASDSTTQSDVGPASDTGRMDNTVRSEEEPVTTEEDEDGVQRTRLYGISGTVDSELNPDDQNDVSDHPSDDHYDEAKSGEP